jgi:uncharacterized protein (TIGR00369 family)
MSKISKQEFTQLISAQLPWAVDAGIEIRNIKYGEVGLVLPYHERSTRPGGTISGPHMMLLADACMYAVVLSMIGKVELAVTTNLNINFLRKPNKTDLIAEGKIIKLGKRLAVLEVSIFSKDDIVAHVTGTYSIPPEREASG